MKHNVLCTITIRDGVVTKKKLCTVTGQEYLLSFPLDKFLLYKAGAFLQDCFSDFTADEREFIHSGITPAEWDDMCKDEES